MITAKLSAKDILQGSRKFFLMQTGRTLFSVNLEVTRRCNLRCDFCDYWRETGREELLSDYGPIIRRLNPLHLTFTGGEPLLRPDLEQVIAGLRRQTDFVYMNLITNGSLLTVKKGLALWHAGLNQLSVSLNFPDQRMDRERGRAGLWHHLAQVLPRLAGTQLDNLCLNTVIMKENLEDLVGIARTAREWGLKVSYSTYNPYKNENPAHSISPEQVHHLERVIEELLAWKRCYRNITNSEFYLRNVSRYFREGGIGGCLAGRKWVQVRCDGTIYRCSEKERLENWTDFRPGRVPLTSCRECWYACRGEAEAPLGIKRIIELNR